MENTNNCSNCRHCNVIDYVHQNSVCNLYNKYTIAAQILCKNECWEKRPKEIYRVEGDKTFIRYK